MENVTYKDFEQTDGSIITFAIIDRGNGEYTSMRKDYYDELEAAKEASGTLSQESDTIRL